MWSYTPDSGNSNVCFRRREVGCAWRSMGRILLPWACRPRTPPAPTHTTEALRILPPHFQIVILPLHTEGCLFWEHTNNRCWNFPWQSRSNTFKQEQAQRWSPATTLVMKHHRTFKPNDDFPTGLATRTQWHCTVAFPVTLGDLIQQNITLWMKSFLHYLPSMVEIIIESPNSSQ